MAVASPLASALSAWTSCLETRGTFMLIGKFSLLGILLRYLTAKHNIPRHFLPESKRYLTNLEVASFKGIVSHINFRTSGKWDIGPGFAWDQLIQYTGGTIVDPSGATVPTPAPAPVAAAPAPQPVYAAPTPAPAPPTYAAPQPTYAAPAPPTPQPAAAPPPAAAPAAPAPARTMTFPPIPIRFQAEQELRRVPIRRMVMI